MNDELKKRLSVGRSSLESDGIELDYEADSDGNGDGSYGNWLWRTYPSSVDPVLEEDSDEGSGVGSGAAGTGPRRACCGRDAVEGGKLKNVGKPKFWS